MNAEGLSILRHSLGLDHAGKGKPYRNHFVTDPASADGEVCESLVAEGLMRRLPDRGEISGGMPIYRVTEFGQKAAKPFAILEREQQKGK